MFLVKNVRPDLAKLAYMDRRAPVVAAPVVAAPVVAAPVVATDTTTSGGGGGGGIFAMFKSYNRKPSATTATTDSTSSDSTASTATATNKATATDTHFVYLGTMQDYKDTRDKGKRSPTSTGSGSGGEEAPYVNVKYAEFKSRSKL
jgi:hypothetical protein